MNSPAIIVAALAATMLTGCTTMGSGVGDSKVPGESAVFNWTAKGPRDGTMTAVRANGTSYTGPFFQVTSETQIDDLSPLWLGWGGIGWGGRGGRGNWGGWGGGGWGGFNDWGPSQQFVTHYSGKVLANLQGADGRMRCRFVLIHPSSGMTGGGQGQCEAPTGGKIDATFVAQ